MNREPIDVVIEEIRVAMTRRRITLRDLARQLGANEHWLYRRMGRQADISVVDLLRIAEALEMDARDLLPASTRTGLPGVTGTFTPIYGRPSTYPAASAHPAGPRRPVRIAA